MLGLASNEGPISLWSIQFSFFIMFVVLFIPCFFGLGFEFALERDRQGSPYLTGGNRTSAGALLFGIGLTVTILDWLYLIPIQISFIEVYSHEIPILYQNTAILNVAVITSIFVIALILMGPRLFDRSQPIRQSQLPRPSLRARLRGFFSRIVQAFRGLFGRIVQTFRSQKSHRPSSKPARGYPIPRTLRRSKQKPYSDGDAPRCIICNHLIAPGELILICKQCNTRAHRSHMEDWLQKNDTCPLCKHKLR